WRVLGENLLDRLAGLELAPDDADLPLDAAKGGDDEKRDALPFGVLPHGSPSAGRVRREPVLAPIRVPLHDLKPPGFLDRAQAARGKRAGVDPQVFEFPLQLRRLHAARSLDLFVPAFILGFFGISR